jgi:hypothetical protein
MDTLLLLHTLPPRVPLLRACGPLTVTVVPCTRPFQRLSPPFAKPIDRDSGALCAVFLGWNCQPRVEILIGSLFPPVQSPLIVTVVPCAQCGMDLSASC